MHFSKKTVLLISIVAVAAVLRLVQLDQFPPALYSDEVNQGYNAYSILTTGKDEHGEFLPVALRSFGDWKPPLPTYLMIPTIAWFGLNEWGVRLPGAVLGVLSVPMVYLLVHKLWQISGETKNTADTVALFSATLLAISPWHIHQSRMAMLTAVALFFLLVGVYSFVRGLQKPKWFVVSVASFALGVYAYYGMRVIVPLSVVFLAIFFRRKIPWRSPWILYSGIVGLIILLPLGVAFVGNPDVIFGRAQNISIFHDRGISLLLWERIAQDGSEIPPAVARFFHNKPTLYTLDILRRTLEHVSGDFLFFTGDQHLPFQLPNMGVLYLADAVFLVVGTVFLARLRVAGVVFFWALAAIFPAALTFLTPTANRSFNMVVPAVILVGYAVAFLDSRTPTRLRRWYRFGVVGLYTVSLAFFLQQYMVELPKNHADWWLWGNKQMVAYVTQQQSNYTDVVISGNISMPYTFFLFYNQVDPDDFRARVHRDSTPDRFGFEHVSSFGRFWFPRAFAWEKHSGKFGPKTLLVTRADESVGAGLSPEKIIRYPNDEPAYHIYAISNEKS